MLISKLSSYGSVSKDDQIDNLKNNNKFADDHEQEEEIHPNDLFRKENVAIAAAYFSVGFVGAFMATPLNVYLVEIINAEPNKQNTIGILQSLPWSLKLLFGFLSDTCPIGGMHRKPYLTIGALVYSFSFIFYSLLNTDNLLVLAACIFIGTLGLIQLDVMADTMCVERSKFEPDETRGQMQASCYSIRFTGSLIGAVLGACFCNKAKWGWGLSFKQVAFVNGFLPFLLVAPCLMFLREKYKRPKMTTSGKGDGVIVSLSSSTDITPRSLIEMTENDHLLAIQMVPSSFYSSSAVDFTSSPTHHEDSYKTASLSHKSHHHHHHEIDSDSGSSDSDSDSDSSEMSVPDPREVLVEMQAIGPGARREMAVGTMITHHPHTHTHGHHTHHCHHHTTNHDNNDTSIAANNNNRDLESLQVDVNKCIETELHNDNTSTDHNSPSHHHKSTSSSSRHHSRTSHTRSRGRSNRSKSSASKSHKSHRSHHHSNENEEEDDEDKPLSISNQLIDIWETVQLQAVWRPMAFVYLYNILQVPNVAWQSFLQLSLHFEPWILGLTATLGCLMTLLGVLAYKYLFFKASWKAVYIWSTLLTAFFSLTQLVLVFQWNTKYMGINNYFFSLGDDVISAYIAGIQFLPVCIMYMRLCPDGAEGSSYAMLTTFGNIALVCASNVGNNLSRIWDVSNTAMRQHDVSGLWKLTVLTSCLSVTPLLFLQLLPTDSTAQDQLAKSKVRSKIGGAAFLFVLLSSLLWTILSSIMSLISNM